MIDQALAEVEPLLGTAPACRALGASRASLYRRRTPAVVAREQRRRPTPARALSELERAAVLGELHSERFVDATFNRSSQRFVVDSIVSTRSAAPLVFSSRVSCGVGC